jgi:hypothetical protein
MDNQPAAPIPTPQPPAPTAAAPPAPPTPPAPSQKTVPSLANVDSGVWTFVRKRWWMYLLLVIVSTVVTIYLNVWGILIFIIGVTATKLLYENALFKAFAAANNFSYQKKNLLAGQTGMLFRIGHSPSFHDIVEGWYKEWPLELFLYEYTVGYGRDSHTYHRAVMSINFQTAAPPFVLRRHTLMQIFEEEGESLKSNGYTQEVNLEGDFSKHFKLYIHPGTQVDVLAILTPDKMELVQSLDKYELELTPNGILYIYSHGYITKKQDLLDIFSIIEAVAPKIASDVNRSKEISQFAAAATAPPAPPAQT